MVNKKKHLFDVFISHIDKAKLYNQFFTPK